MYPNASQMGSVGMIGAAMAAQNAYVESPREERATEAMLRSAQESLARLTGSIEVVDGLRSRLLGLGEAQAANAKAPEPVRSDLAQIYHVLEIINALSTQLGQKLTDLQRI